PPPQNSAATAVAASLEALIAAVRAEARTLPTRHPRRPPDDYDLLYARACTILEADAARPGLTIHDVATRLGVGRRRLERAFHLRDETPAGVLRAHRLRIARDLLAADDAREIVEIAALSGFPSARALKDALAAAGERHPKSAQHRPGPAR
ncbi:helix-turn-helix domain-containing protein, partial [Microbacterium testaceum]|uniref:helix-turn-helix domain-containing protein n=1 Tax=Microbacterium testaceum TaxID=2033 RepID=UPI003445168D